MRVLSDLLAYQDPDARHTLLTRVLVSGILLAATLVLHGFYGLLATIGAYLIGVELMDLEKDWALVPLGVSLLTGLWSAARGIRDYWAFYGHGD